MRRALVFLIACSLCAAADGKDVFPIPDWQPVAKAESAGFSSARLEALRAWMKTQNTTAMMVIAGGHVLFKYGDVKRVSVLASARKSVLGMLYGRYVADGTINLHKTVKEIGLDDVQPFLPIEENATLEHLLMARSGIYHPDDSGGPGVDNPESVCPARGSQYPGTFFCYYNWDFDAAGTAFEKLTGRTIYDALESDLARPIGMQDFDRALQKKDSALPYSKHPLYHMYLSTRDMARLGLLMLRRGKWNGKEVVDEHWADYLTTLVTPVNELFPQALRSEAERNEWRFGFGVMWWVWDTPRLPRGIASGDLYGAYTAQGLGGQYITVIPARDLVVVHKVDIREVPSEKYVTNQEFHTMLNMLFSSRCGQRCP